MYCDKSVMSNVIVSKDKREGRERIIFKIGKS